MELFSSIALTYKICKIFTLCHWDIIVTRDIVLVFNEVCEKLLK